MIVTNDIYLTLGKKRADDLAYDSSGTNTASVVITALINNAYNWLLAKAIASGKTVDVAGITDDSKIQNQATLYYTIYLLFCYAQQEKAGEDYRVNAFNILISIFGTSAVDFSDAESKPVNGYISVSNSSGKKLDTESLSGAPYSTYK